MLTSALNKITTCSLLVLFCTFAYSEARFPVDDDDLPQTAAQTWDDQEPKVEIKSGTQITTPNGDRELGYESIETNQGSCDGSNCIAEEDLRLDDRPDFSTPSDAITISINGDITLPRPGDPTGSVYEVSGETKLDGDTLTLTAPTTLYAGTFTVQSGAEINPGGDPNNLVIVTTGDATIQNSTVNAHIFSSKYLKIDGGTVNGTITTNELLMDAGGSINGVDPAPPSQTCTINGNNQDFVVEFDVTGSNSYQEIVFSGGNESDTLWYTQDEKSGSDYVFNEQRLVVGQDYKLRIEVERGQGNSTSRAHYYWVVNGNKELQESKDADLKNGTITGTGVGLETLDCSEEDVSPPPIYSDNALYEFGTAQCNLTNGSSCTIPFTQDYTIAPLVFVMPTIDTVEPDEDKPATLYISSEITAGSTSVQVTKDTVDLPEMDNDVAITEVSYLIIEPGVANFNGHTVVAGYVNTDAENSKSDSGTSTEVDYSDFGLNAPLSSPVVLHQLQTRNNGDKWMTSGKLGRTDDTSVRLFFELSASKDDGHNYVEEKIAFIATEAVSALQVGNYNVEFQRGFRNPSQTGNDPMNDACTKGYADVGLDRVDGIIGKKQERRGGHGGWTRRCEIKDNNQVSFVIDEDFNNRGHLREEIGYFAFERVSVELPDICPYFPAAIATNNYVNDLPWTAGQLSLSGFDNFIKLQQRESISFGSKSISGQGTGCSYGTGGVEDCDVDTFLAYEELPAVLPTFQVGTDSIDCTNGCVTPLDPDEYDSLVIGEDVVVILNSGEYWFNSISFTADKGKLRVNGSVIIHYKTMTIDGSHIGINDDGSSDELTLIGHGANATMALNQDLLKIRANIYIDPLSQSGFTYSLEGLDFEGALVVAQLVLSGRDSTMEVSLPENCDTSTDDYELRLTPSIDISLTCDVVEATATIYKNGSIDTSYGGTVYLEVDGTQVDSTNAVSGVASFDVESTVVKTASVRAYTTPSSDTIEDTASYEFVPYLLEVTPSTVGVIANHPEDIEIRPLECDSGGSPISSTKYVGVTDVELSNLTYTSPSNPDNAASLSFYDSNGAWVALSENGTLSTTFDFKTVNGEVVADSQIRYPESGQVSYSLSSDYCIDDENGDPICETSSGSQTVQSRPWTFALCSAEDDTTIAGTATGGNGYLASGALFDVQVVPIAWDGSGLIAGAIDTTNLCAETVTQNFFMAGAPTANVVMSHAVDTPSGGSEGNLAGTLEKDHDSKSSSGDYYDYSNLAWDEVGSIQLQVDTESSYFGMDINQGYRNFGRFYPALFTVISTTWAYPNSPGTFVYMGQPFDGIEFEVEAFTTGGGSVQNYSDDDYSVQASFNLYENSTEFASRFVSPSMEEDGWDLVDSSRSVGTFNFGTASDCLSAICWNKRTDFVEDGPFNSAENIEDSLISVSADSPVDPVTYTSGGEQLTEQPDIRFGRIALQDVGSIEGNTFGVPLAVEYWNGSRFLSNTDDSSTEFEGSHHCYQVIRSDHANNAALSGSDTVSFGESNDLVASQTDAAREQVRFWLTLDSTAGENGESDSCTTGHNDLPWLRYNWDGSDSDEEDPSAVVTFGIHRGNDKVIFRGESGLTGQ